MGGGILILVPTKPELRGLELQPRADVTVALAGFGVIAAALRAAEEIASARPSRVILAGIAGTYDARRAPPGSAVSFASVAVDGIGAGEGADFLDPKALGFPMIDADDGRSTVWNEMPLQAEPKGPLLLTVASAAGSEAEVARRRARWPRALAEDMEGFAVALACSRAGVPCQVVRGISNVAGDRATSRWRVIEALRAASTLVRSLLDS